MSTKEELISIVKQWISVDNEIRGFQAELKKRRTVKKDLTAALVDVMKDNDIDCFDVKDGKLLYTQTRSKAPLNKKTLLAALAQRFPEDPERARELSDFILETRQENIKESIRLKEQK